MYNVYCIMCVFLWLALYVCAIQVVKGFWQYVCDNVMYVAEEL